MAIFENILNAMRANDDEYDEYIEYEQAEAKAAFEEVDEEEYDAPPSRTAKRREPEYEAPRSRRREPEYEAPRSRHREPEYEAPRKRHRAPAQDFEPVERGRAKLELVTPTTFSEAAGIADSLKRSRRAVIMSLENADSETARRLLDFLSGAVYGIGGNIRKFSERSYIITPDNYDLISDDVDAVENSNYTF